MIILHFFFQLLTAKTNLYNMQLVRDKCSSTNTHWQWCLTHLAYYILSNKSLHTKNKVIEYCTSLFAIESNIMC